MSGIGRQAGKAAISSIIPVYLCQRHFRLGVGLEGAHPQVIGASEGLAVGDFGWLNLRGSALRVDIAEEAQDPCLVGPFVVLASQLAGTLGELARLLSALSQEIGLAQIDPPD
jgi:hypothetical protein